MAEPRKFLYLHGFASSGASGTVDLLRREFWERKSRDRIAVLAPDIPVDPALALPMLKALAAKERPALIIGTSMGGMYAQQLRGFERICINPAFEMSRLYSVLSVGRHKWLNARRDGALTFQLTKEIIARFAAMEANQFADWCEEDSVFCHGLFGDADELTASSRAIFETYYPGMGRTFEGGHRMNADVAKRVLFPLIHSLGF
ncbi:MAG: YqiA/YcfP family alpha/beta fold hydrolase [Kiritimatiellia bacterium]